MAKSQHENSQLDLGTLPLTRRLDVSDRLGRVLTDSEQRPLILKAAR
jgi:hypothetical protein